MSILDQAESVLSAIVNDPILLASFKARNPELIKAINKKATVPLSNCPRLSRIEAADLTIFDNHKLKERKKGERAPRSTRFGANLKVWANEEFDFDAPSWNVDFRFLWSPKDIQYRVDHPDKRPKVSEETWRSIVQAGQSGSHAALAVKRGDGTTFYDDYVLAVKFSETGMPDLAILSNPTLEIGFQFPDFRQRQISKNVVARSRHAKHINLATWKTGEIADLMNCNLPISDENGAAQ
jgi:hypothetical protein